MVDKGFDVSPKGYYPENLSPEKQLIVDQTVDVTDIDGVTGVPALSVSDEGDGVVGITRLFACDEQTYKRIVQEGSEFFEYTLYLVNNGVGNEVDGKMKYNTSMYYGNRRVTDFIITDVYPDEASYPNDKVYLRPINQTHSVVAPGQVSTDSLEDKLLRFVDLGRRCFFETLTRESTVKVDLKGRSESPHYISGYDYIYESPVTFKSDDKSDLYTYTEVVNDQEVVITEELQSHCLLNIVNSLGSFNLLIFSKVGKIGTYVDCVTVSENPDSSTRYLFTRSSYDDYNHVIGNQLNQHKDATIYVDYLVEEGSEDVNLVTGYEVYFKHNDLVIPIASDVIGNLTYDHHEYLLYATIHDREGQTDNVTFLLVQPNGELNPNSPIFSQISSEISDSILEQAKLRWGGI